MLFETAQNPGESPLLREALATIRALRAQLKTAAQKALLEPIAIVGAGCRFPGGANTLDEYWRLLHDGVDAIAEMPAGRWDAAAYFDPDPDAPGKADVREGGFLADIASFDAGFFGISPREVLRLDPQQRLLLEVAWEALENAGVAPDQLSGSLTGVYFGLMGNDYAFRQAHVIDRDSIDPYMLTGNDPSFAAGRLAHFLGLQGPAMVVETACSSSLVSVHLACQALRARECDMALAGGVNLVLDPVTNVMLSKLRALAKDGRSKAFDASADGYGRGEGCGVVALKRLSDAVSGRDRILAVVRGSAVNHDGPSAGLTVPNGPAQERLIRRALDAAGVAAADIDYVEAHGTGTLLGDPIEAGALAAALGTERKKPLLVGSAKTNLGHLEAAAGIAGLLKVALALEHGEIPAHLHFKNPNAHIAWDELPLQIVSKRMAWPEHGRARLAGVSSFGLSGVNAHVIVEQAPRERGPQAGTSTAAANTLSLSAKTETALRELARRYAEHLTAHPDTAWVDVCYTTNTGRARFEHRLSITAQSTAEALRKLRDSSQWNETPAGVATNPPGGRRIALPTYPFERSRFWVLDDVPVREKTTATGATFEAFEKQVAEVLGLSAPPDREKSLLDLGLDSLMSAELRGWVKTELNVELNLREFLSGASVAGLWAKLSEKLTAAPVSSALSHGQRALWFLHQSAPESAAYNVGIALRLRAGIDAGKLEQVFRTVIARHASLRTTFAVADGEPVQLVHPGLVFSIERVDATGWNEKELSVRVAEVYRQPFDLERGPLLRASLYMRSASESVLTLTIHHIVCDGVSCWTILDEIQSAYSGRALPPAPRNTYVDYAEWEQKLLDGDDGARLWAYWQNELAGEIPSLALPFDHARPALKSYRGASLEVQIPEKTTRALRNLARDANATLYQTLLAAFHLLLHRYSGQEEIVVGSVASSRPDEFAGVVGYFVNPLPIKAKFAGDPEFRALLDQVRRKSFDALDHREFPFPLLVERLRPRREPGRSPIFQADFSLGKPAPFYRRTLGADSMVAGRFDLSEEEGQFDLGLHVTEEERTLNGIFKYDAALFNLSTIQRMAACFGVLVAAIAADPHARVSAIPLLEASERQKLLGEWSRNGAEIDTATLVPELFERQAERTPGAIAVELFPDTESTLTYAQLNGRANHLAHRLLALHLGTEFLVGVCLAPSLDLAVALLAVLKAGGAYVPLDPSYPEERLAYMLDDAKAPVLITTRKLAARFAAMPAAVIYVDECEAAETAGNPVLTTTPENLAYVIYTSGSTGRPKGAMVTHRGFTNYLQWAIKEYRVAEGCGAPVSSSVSFDATITSLLVPLLTGGTVVFLPEEGMVEALASLLRVRRGWSLLKITPAHLEMLSYQLRGEECVGLAKVLVIGGEALRGETLEFWQRRAPETRLINEYGPTETVVGCCVHEVKQPIAGAVPIGRPIANMRLYVLDGNREPVPVGVTGELYIGGPGVARGYLRQPEQTAAVFITNPFGNAGDRLYRSGDLARYLADGTLETLGRADAQVKIRGYRIEPGEIESLLREHPQVSECLVAVREGIPGHRQLVGYTVSRGESPSAAELRRFLGAKLPSHMIPSLFVALERFPLTPNGKIDRRTLPAPQADRDGMRFTPPRDSLEIKLAALWEEILGVRPIGVSDNFFDLGGHSLLAVRLVARVAQDIGQSLPLGALLGGPTIAQLADILRGNGTRIVKSALVPIQPSGSKRPFFCVPGAGGNAIYLYGLARCLGPEQPFYGLEGAGLDGDSEPHTTVEQMAAYYVEAIRKTQPHGPYRLGGHSLGGWVAFAMAQQLRREGEEIDLLAIIDTPVPTPAHFHDTSDWDTAQWIAELARKIAQLLNPSLDVPLETLRSFATAQEQLQYFREALVRNELYPAEAGVEHLGHALRIFQAHGQVRYAMPANILPLRIALFRTANHHPSFEQDPAWGWNVAGAVSVHLVPGEHLTVLRAPHVEALAKELAPWLSSTDSLVAHATGG